MPDNPPGSITQLLFELRSPTADAVAVRNRLYAALYRELRKSAAGVMRAERSDHTLQPTALVHEAFLKLVDRDRVDWRDRSHFLGVATRAMRQVLVDHARRRGAVKRGRDWKRVTLAEPVAPGSDAVLQIVDLDRALQRLEGLSERMACVAEFRIFGGMTHREIADQLSVSVRTVAEDWSVARRWIGRELGCERAA
jgi:RNA polymerase sigma factor (TIGR02999 family)